MKTGLFIPIVFLLIYFNVNQGFAQEENEFYTETNHLGVVKNLVDDYAANGNDNLDDSEVLQQAIDEVTALENGGRIIIPEGAFYFSEVKLKSNVHLEIDKSAVIHPTPRIDSKNYTIFVLGDKNNAITNVSIRGIGGKYKLDLTNLENTNVRVFQLQNVQNFLLADLDVEDEETKFSAITFGYVENNGTYSSPQNGVIKNSNISNAHYGYGLIQAQAAKNVLFKDLSGAGGVTLRFETGYDKMNELQVGGVFDMYGENISCVDGNAALMISPHAIQNGHVEVKNVISVNCGFAVRIGKGYVKKEQEELGISPGHFANSSKITGVKATFGSSAQLKLKHEKYIPCDLRDQLYKKEDPLEEIYIGPSVVAILNGAEGEGDGKYKVDIQDVNASGFLSQKNAIIGEEDTFDCEDTEIITGIGDNLLEVEFKIYPNPFKHVFRLNLPEGKGFEFLQIIDVNGKVIDQQNIKGKGSSFEISGEKLNLRKGMYFVKIVGANICLIKKVLKN
ncbi:T9SS type A sorting domain-containing protein [Labilibaculum antarcticum]|uniref:Secretion system C-terminal sorting domain-containing protein n=1 Tax=Labilibaculum antarcticum TaxID=1717717 RepID=A0A1Y1CLC9_9BACT|nr:T9SS type A sorting domain-containing protein [Labilibaculum antarcticum]BAX81104.1 hypothetical protein ALGA_2792 [Labilibaculum antarcticum]